ncbi:MAG: hypothetical protein LBQ66_08765 [Planctomycetaceae bacterium]|jgi:hypothetical protein|nr:hypothetical protein [Planctomycetaceae bacterium]
MNAFKILETVNTLPFDQRMFIAERIIHSVRNESQKISLRRAAELAVKDYQDDKELTEFTQLDGENFYETR